MTWELFDERMQVDAATQRLRTSLEQIVFLAETEKVGR